MSRSKAVVGGIGVCAAVIAAGVLVAPTAGATEHHGDGDNSAFAISASGLLKIDPTPYADDSDGYAQKSLVELSVGPLKSGTLNAQAGHGGARASIENLRVDLGPLTNVVGRLLSVKAIEAKCNDNGKASSSLAQANIVGIKLDVAAPPNTKVGVPGLASVVLNKQKKNEDGSVTVTALSISVDGIQKLDLVSATCSEGNGNPTTTPTPTSTNTNPTTSGNNGGGEGQAPRPTPVKSHLDVTG